ncbi:MAG: phospholipase D-like domain-containing protein [Bacteroidales bacterium]|jgi:cardiolipin synthase|nr:phospholipase D-like domain-containing protein [Bacteroidales bacterium]
MLVIIFDDGDSGRKIGWILIISILPVIGIILYILIGINFRHSWYFKRKHKKFIEIFDGNSDNRIKNLLFGHDIEGKVQSEFRPLAKLLSKDSSTTVSDGNGIEVIVFGHRKFELLMEDLKNAKKSIHMEYFYFRKDKGSKQIKEMLMKKAREGIKVRFIHENIANINISPGYYNEMKKAGVEVVKFTKSHIPFINFFTQLNYRDHRKIVVIDGRIGYTGGMNISDDYFLRWRDTHLRITGNAVSGLQYSFLNTWITAGGSISSDFNNYFPSMPQSEQNHSAANDQVAEIEKDLARTPIENLDMTFKLAGNDKLIQIVPDEPDSQWPIIQMGAVWAVQHAKKYIYIQTPYFVPPDPILSALKSAALSGTDVRIMLPKKADLFFMGPANKSYFSECLEAGIKIYERSGRFIHSKTFVSDDYLSEIGSANMDFRSFTIDYELNAYIYDENTAIVNKAIFMKDMEACTEITLSSWEKRPWYKKLLQRLLRLFAPLL